MLERLGVTTPIRRLNHLFHDPKLSSCGTVAGVWRWERTAEKATLVVEAFERLPRGVARDVRAEAARLVRFVEPDATSYAVKL